MATKGTSILSSHNKKVRKIFQRILKERDIDVRLGANITGMEVVSFNGTSNNTNYNINSNVLPLNRLLTSDASTIPIVFHECLWCTSAGAPAWLSSQTPLSTTKDGFVKVEDTYQCLGYPGIFAAGDCCHNVHHPRPKGKYSSAVSLNVLFM